MNMRVQSYMLLPPVVSDVSAARMPKTTIVMCVCKTEAITLSKFVLNGDIHVVWRGCA